MFPFLVGRCVPSKMRKETMKEDRLINMREGKGIGSMIVKEILM